MLIFGSVPITAFATLTKLVPKKSVMSPQLSQLAGCNMAMGLSDDIDALIAELTPAAIIRTQMHYSATGLSDSAVRWLAVGERGSSSDTMFATLTGIVPVDAKRDAKAYPHDPDDLRRCRLLLDQVPELTVDVEKLSAISPIWARIAGAWDTLCETMDDESPQWRDGGGKGHRTYELLNELVNPAEYSSKAIPTQNEVVITNRPMKL